MGLPVFSHSACLAHDTGPMHAESASRLEAVTRGLRDAYADLEWIDAPRATRGQLLRVHTEALLHAVLETRPQTRIWLDPDTVLSPASAEAGLRAAGAVVAAVEKVLSGEAKRAFCAVRPPGHHATTCAPMGFCLFNSIAVGAAHALDKFGLSRVVIADFDVHHGNGTQAIFDLEPRVVFASSHQMPLYPDSGHATDRGVNNIFNAPLAPGAGSA
jgi:acetoin utilization deacetylase AcuC-like enzyme